MSWDRSAERGAWARKVIPSWALTRYEVADRLGVGIRWLAVLLDRHPDIKNHVGYVRRHVRMPDGRVRVRYAQAWPPSALEALALTQLAGDANRALQALSGRRRSGRRSFGRRGWSW